MAVDDYLDGEVAVVAAATAAVFSPQVRGAMRKGLVYGTAGVMTAGDAAVSAAKGAGNAVQRAVGRGSNSNRASSAGSRSSSGATRALVRYPPFHPLERPHSQHREPQHRRRAGFVQLMARQAGTRSSVERADQRLDRIASQLNRFFTKEAKPMVLKTAGRVREEAEDIVAEAKSVRGGKRS